MALKDWKKDNTHKEYHEKAHNLGFYRNKLTKESILINHNPRGIAHTPYHVLIQEHGMIKTMNSFKTKSQALKFAKDYMKKH